MATKDLKIKVSAETTQAQSQIKSLSSDIDGMASSASKSASSWKAYAAAGAAAAVAIKAVINAASQMVAAYKVQEQAEAKLQSTLTATGNAIGMCASDLTGLASSLQSVTTYGDETIIGVEQIMVATKAISKDALPQATEASLDMAAAMGTSATEAAKKLAKALADPASGLESLKDANIIFTDSEKTMITEMASSGKTLEAQQLILDKVASSYGGIARSLADTDTGKLTQISNVWGDIKEGLGNGIVNALGPAFDWLLKQLNRISQKIADLNAEKNIERDLDAGTAGKKYSPEILQQYIDEYSAEAESFRKTFNKTYKDMGDLSGLTFEDIAASAYNTDTAIFGLLENYQHYSSLASRLKGSKLTAIERSTVSDIPSGSAAGSGTSGTEGGTGTAATAEKVKTLNDYIKENLSLSETARVASIEASIAEAQAWGDSEDATSGQRMQLNEIIDSLERQKAEITGVKKAYMALSDYRDAKAEGFKGMTSDEVDAMTEELKVSRDLADTNQGQKNMIDSAIYALSIYKDGLADTTVQITELDKFIQQNGSMSETYTAQQTNAQLALAESLRQTVEDGSDYAKILDEIIAKLKGVGEESKSSLQKVDDFFDTYASSATSLLSAGFVLADQLMQNEIDTMQSALDELTDKWNSYLSDLQDKYDAQTEALSMSYALGRISAEDYYSAVQELQDEKSDAEQQAADEKDALQSRINAMEEKQFNADKANSIAQATISGAQAVVGFLANPGGVTGTVLSVMAGLTAAAQIATIASKQYTPALAEGGVVTKPTTALIGEAGPEMVLPLSKAEDMGFGGSGIHLTIQTGDVYTKESLSEQIFEGIQKAQRTGLLPGWRY